MDKQKCTGCDPAEGFCFDCRAAEHASLVSAGTIDTPELLARVKALGNSPDAWQKLIAHIDQHVAAAVAEARKEGYNSRNAEVDALILEKWDLEEKLRAATAPVSAVPGGKFKRGDVVRKTKGSQWSGEVVGTYATALTPEGYAVESSTERGSVQIYPAGALELVSAGVPVSAVPDVAEQVADMLEVYAESYDTMARVTKKDGGVSATCVATDIRQNMITAARRIIRASLPPSSGAPVSAAEPDRLDEALAGFLAEHTRLSQDGIDQHAICLALGLNAVALRPVPDEAIAEWRATGYVPADGQELPPLPTEWQCETAMCPKLYTADQMREYVLADRAMRQPQGDDSARIDWLERCTRSFCGNFGGEDWRIIGSSVWHGTLREAIDGARIEEAERAAKQAGKEGA